MAKKDLHDEPFDEGTIAKLQILKIMRKLGFQHLLCLNSIQFVFLIFAGTGTTKTVSQEAHPYLEKIKEQVGHIFQNRVRVVIHLNEFEPNKKEQRKFDLLRTACQVYLEANADVQRAIENKLHNEDFEQLFTKYFSIRNYHRCLS